MPGRLIVLEGPDGSGKATQVRLLCEALKQNGARVLPITFPDYESDSSALVRMYLSGAFGQSAADVNAYAASSFFAVDRYASYKTAWGAFYHAGGVVVADRYTTSNAVHQCAKLPRDAWEAFLAWLFDFEYGKLGIPAPDDVVYLDADPEVSQRLLLKRYHGSEEKKDIHERDAAFQRQSAEAGRFCARKYGWHRVLCTQNSEMRPAGEIAAEISSWIIKR